MNKKTLAVIIPIYNEEESLKDLFIRLDSLVSTCEKFKWQLYLINDGSSDKTEEILNLKSESNDQYKIIHLSRNFGHQYALSAGLSLAEGDFFAIIDADLQDPPELIPEMVDILSAGEANIVYGQRVYREKESFLKKITAKLFYRCFNYMSGHDFPTDTGDFRVFDRKIFESIKELKEYHLFYRGLIAWLGFKSKAFPYKRFGRENGETKYPMKKMIGFAINAILSFSSFPLVLMSYVGFFVSILGVAGLIYIVVLKFFLNQFIPGTSTVLFSVLLLGGIQLVALGIIGQYIGKIFEQVKNRPRFLVGDTKNI